MRRSLAILLVLLVSVALAAPGSAKKPKKVVRKMKIPYTTGSVGSADATGTCPDPGGCAFVGIGPKEEYLSLRIEDNLGLPVAATIGQDQDPNDQFVDRLADFCGQIDDVQVKPGIQVIVWLWAAPSATLQCIGSATGGTVFAEISNLP